MEKHILIDFSGKFQFETIEFLLGQAKEKLSILEIKIGLRKKIVNILIECLENIYKYTKFGIEGDYSNINFFSKISLEKTNDSFIIKAGNTILNSDIEKLKNKIEKVNALNREGLQKFYQEIINDGKISDKGSAGLGIIDIAMKSGKPIVFNFTPKNEKNSFYEIKIEISENIN
ncbi:MAG: hypothetical protein HY738_14480 [Bacteroidia bacterium]|nr:hypothetical protein [Bacteroidia bacterium]